VIQPRDAEGHFISRDTWEDMYALAYGEIPDRIGSRNAVGPYSLAEFGELIEEQHPSLGGAFEYDPEEQDILSDYDGDWDEMIDEGEEWELTADYKED
jgi:hypothetical protein